MIQALRQPQIMKLWIGQAFSSVGDEIYRVGLTWFAVSLLGANTGYLTAGQTAALMLLSFVGGKWADNWAPIKTMVNVDLIRAFIVLIPVAVSFFMPTVPLIVLCAVALALSALSAFFDPAAHSLIPVLAKQTQLRQATNGLMGTTSRMARMVGPAIVGLLSAFIPMIHFFTLDAITFIVSAICVVSLNKHMPKKAPTIKKSIPLAETLKASFRLIQSRPGMKALLLTKTLTSSTWSLSLLIGFPLLVHQLTSGNAQTFGLVMASYGLGNFGGALYFGNRQIKRLNYSICAGYMWLGLGFALIGMAPSIPLIIVAAAFAGFSGPLSDLAFLDLVQRRFAPAELTKVFRLRMAMDSAGTLFFTLISPFLIKTFSVRAVIVFCGATWLLAGLVGFVQQHGWVDETEGNRAAEVVDLIPAMPTAEALSSDKESVA